MRSAIRLSRQLIWAAAMLALTSSTVLAATIPVGGACSLVDAVRSANADVSIGGCQAGSGPDTLTLSANVTLDTIAETFSGENGLPVIRTDITIEGSGFTIERSDAAPDFRIVAVGSTGVLTMRQVTIRNGRGAGMFDAGSGGGVFSADSGRVHLRHTTITGNRAAGWYGGGIYTTSILTMDHCIVSDNHARFGGGIQTDNPAEITIDRTTIMDNTAASSGGGISTQFTFATITESTISGNEAEHSGGGVSVWDAGRMTLRNTTVSDNQAAVNGGGISSFWVTVDLEHATVVGNRAPNGAAILIHDFDPSAPSVVNLSGSIVAAGSGGGTCVGPGIVDHGSNFDDDGSCGPGFAPIALGVDIDSEVRDNGGPTKTHALFAGSSAIDADGVCGLATDQRGALRIDGLCDSGAFEFDAPLLVTMESASATVTWDGVLIRWTTSTEIDTAGFRLLRQTDDASEKSLQSVGSWVPSAGSDLTGADYSVLDDSKASARASRYFIEDVDLFGRVTRHGPIEVQRGSRSRDRARRK